MNRMAGRVTLEDLGDAGLEGEALAGGPGGHVGIAQRVHERAVLALEGGELARVAAFLGLERGAGVVGHQAALTCGGRPRRPGRSWCGGPRPTRCCRLTASSATAPT